MENTGRHPDSNDLKRFPLLNDLNDSQRALLAGSIYIHSAHKNESVIKYGATDTYSFFLLKGVVEQRAPDGGGSTIVAGSASATCPIAQLLPRKYDVVALSDIEYLIIESCMLRDLSANHSDEDDEGLSLSIVPNSKKASEHALAVKIFEDLEKDKLHMPSLPEFAIRIGRALEDETADAECIAKIIQTDLAITAKLVRAANSVLYVGREPVETCVGAIVRLGVNTTHKLVLSFALRELFCSKNFITQKYMHQLWYHSAEVAALCFILARLTKKFDPEHAMLTGLLHDIGVVSIISYIEKYPELVDDEHEIEHVITLLRGVTGEAILKAWGFPDDMAIAAAEAEDWTRDHAPEPDICDLLLIAQLHSYVGTQEMRQHPCMIDIPCFAKLQLGDLNPQRSLKILDEATEQVAQAETLLI